VHLTPNLEGIAMFTIASFAVGLLVGLPIGYLAGSARGRLRGWDAYARGEPRNPPPVLDPFWDDRSSVDPE
jgi:hypothetical protein